MDFKNINPKTQRIIIAGKYLLQEKLGAGSFGTICSASPLDDSSIQLAIKLEKRMPGMYITLDKEAKIVSDLKDEAGFPVFYDYGQEDGFSYLVINLLGLNIEKVFKLCNQRFSLKTVLMLGNQMLTRIEGLHNKGYIHRDIKPENFVMGLARFQKTLFMIDFGLARSYKDANGKHIPIKDNKGLIGTARYASINAHLGVELSRRDDLEEIGYTLIYLLTATLPWMNLKAMDKNAKYNAIKDKKINTPVDVLCKDLPAVFFTYMTYVRGLGFTDTPNYKFLRNLFKKVIVDNDMEVDYEFDWLPKTGSVSQLPVEMPLAQAIHVREYKDSAMAKKSLGIKDRRGVSLNPITKTTETPKGSEKLAKKISFANLPESTKPNEHDGDETRRVKAIKQEKIQKVVKIVTEKFKDKIKGGGPRVGRFNRNDCATSYHSSKVLNFTVVQNEDNVPAEISIHNAPNDNMEVTTTMIVRKKTLGHINTFFNSTDSLEGGPDKGQDIPSALLDNSPAAKDTREKTVKESVFKKSAFHQNQEKAKFQEENYENLSEDSITEWKDGISLSHMISKQKFSTNFKRNKGL